MKQVFHPKAFLSHKRNVKMGLATRTRILRVLEKHEAKARDISDQSGLRYSVVGHHLRLLEVEKVAARKRNRKPFVWELTGVGQQRLVSANE